MRELLHRHLPGLRITSVSELGSGLDNHVYLVNDDLILRLAREPDPESTLREAELLRQVGALSPLPVPSVRFADAEAGAICYDRLPGRPLHGLVPADPGRLADELGRFLSVLHGSGLTAPIDDYPAGELLADARRDYAEVAGQLPAEARELVGAFLRREPPESRAELRLCHNDLGAEHLLADPETGAITGVLDWTDAALTDPAADFALIYRDFGPEVFRRTLAGYGGSVDPELVAFRARCALLEDLAYGLGLGPRRYFDHALANLARTFS